MPSNWLYIDSNFPTFTGDENLKEQVTTIQNYMYMLVEQLRYTLHNLDLSNMNEAAVDDWENAITEPIYIHLEDSDERITQLAITAAGLSARMEDAEGNITTLQATATGLAAQITDAEGDFAALCTEPPGEERPDGLYTLRYGEIQIMAIAKIQQMAEEIAKLKEQVAALSAGKE